MRGSKNDGAFKQEFGGGFARICALAEGTAVVASYWVTTNAEPNPLLAQFTSSIREVRAVLGHKPTTRPYVFAIIPTKQLNESSLVELNKALEAKGYFYTETIEVTNDAPLSIFDRQTRHIVIYFTYKLREGDDITLIDNAMELIRVAKILKRGNVSANICNMNICYQLLRAQGMAKISNLEQFFDRDLTLGDDEELVEDLTSSSVRSSVWLIRKRGVKLLRKSFSNRYSSFVQNEIAARDVLMRPEVIEIIERRGNVLYMPFVEGLSPLRFGLMEFCEREKASRIFEFLAHINRMGYSMVDINPNSFLFSKEMELKVCDFEFFTKTEATNDLTLSHDFTGRFSASAAPHKNGYNRYWYDAVGGPWLKMRAASELEYRIRKLYHLLTYRIPIRTARLIESYVRFAVARISRRLGLWRAGSGAQVFRTR